LRGLRDRATAALARFEISDELGEHALHRRGAHSARRFGALTMTVMFKGFAGS
jgi:hypothetical protein